MADGVDPEAELLAELTLLRSALARKLRTMLDKDDCSAAMVDVARRFLSDQNVVLPPDPLGLRAAKPAQPLDLGSLPVFEDGD